MVVAICSGCVVATGGGYGGAVVVVAFKIMKAGKTNVRKMLKMFIP